VWGNSKPHHAESLHVHIYRLRNKLAPFHIQIETMVNVGYRLVPMWPTQSSGGANRRRANPSTRF
jgi:DNA-binding winged helix-turn-helix (wHTH) protein